MSSAPHTTPAERRAHARPSHACTADQCRQGRTACPCPQACEVPAPDADPLHDDPATGMELVGMALFFAAFVVIVILAVRTCASA